MTIPYQQSFFGKGKQPPKENETERNTFNYCGCGWPQHMLVPKGQPEGQKFDLFVMVSDDVAKNQEVDENGECTESSSFCGLRGSLYPDSRAMGYPFDRHSPVKTLADFVAKYTNMASVPIQIRHSHTLVPS